MKKTTIAAILIEDANGGFQTLVRDVYSVIFRSKRYASRDNAMLELDSWVTDIWPGGVEIRYETFRLEQYEFDLDLKPRERPIYGDGSAGFWH